MKKIIVYIILASCFLLNGCTDWLEILPKNEWATADYWKTKEDVEAVIASGYIAMRNTTPYLINWGELRGASIYAHTGKEEQKLQDFKLTPSSSLCDWSAFYEVLNMANSVIEYAPGVMNVDDTYREETMNSHLTEAYFMRALIFFYLVRNFNEAPMVRKPYVDDSAPYSIAKSSSEEMITQIKNDIVTALNTGAAKEFYYDDEWKDASKGRVTKWALYALMADVCLWHEDYDECIQYADFLINSTSVHRPAFMQTSNLWFSMFNPGNSNESIFEINWDQATFDQTDRSPSQYFTVSTGGKYRYTQTMCTRLYMESPLYASDINIPSVRTEWGAYVNMLDADYSIVNIYCIWKYMGSEYQDKSMSRNKDANYIIYRVSDVMLMKAEALIWKGSAYWQEAVDILNQIRKRACLNDLDVVLSEETELTMLEYLLYERDIEFAAEGKRWYDLLRFAKGKNFKYKEAFINVILTNNQTAGTSWLRSVLRNEYAWYLPVSESDLKTNTLLVQNPYYQVTSN